MDRPDVALVLAAKVTLWICERELVEEGNSSLCPGGACRVGAPLGRDEDMGLAPMRGRYHQLCLALTLTPPEPVTKVKGDL